MNSPKNGNLEYDLWCYLLKASPGELETMEDQELKRRIDAVQKTYNDPKSKHQRLRGLRNDLIGFVKRKALNDKLSNVVKARKAARQNGGNTTDIVLEKPSITRSRSAVTIPILRRSSTRHRARSVNR